MGAGEAYLGAPLPVEAGTCCFSPAPPGPNHRPGAAERVVLFCRCMNAGARCLLRSLVPSGVCAMLITPCLGALACRAVLQRLFAPTLKFLGPASQPPQRHANKGLCSLRDFLVPRPVWWRSARRLRELSDNTRAWLERTLAWIGPKEPPGLGIGAVGLCQVAPPQQPHSLWGCASFQPPRRACACLARTDIERAHTVFFCARAFCSSLWNVA